MKLAVYGSFLIISLFFFSCKKDSYNINEEFTLKFNKATYVMIDGKKTLISFKKLEEESRCPPEAFCTWAGQVAITIELEKKNKFSLGQQHTTIPSAVTYKNHLIILKNVYATKEKYFAVEKHYEVTLLIK